MTKNTPHVTICIVTRDRKDDLLQAVESCLAQEYPSFGVRVYDNGSSDGTADALRRTFPEVDLYAAEENLGAATQRNRCLRESQAEYVFSLDDDGYYTATDTLALGVDFLESHPDAAVLAMPFVEPATRRMATWKPPPDPDGDGIPVRSFVACACALRREAIVEAGAYRSYFMQWGEERDLSIRLIERGYTLLYAPAPTVVHLGSSKRNRGQMEDLGIRNTLLFDYLNLPSPYAGTRIAVDSVRLLFHKVRRPRDFFARWDYLRTGWTALRTRRELRDPVAYATYRAYRDLPGHGPVQALETLPPPLRRERQPEEGESDD